ncbi:MAG: DedA family protein [Burkholderiales bacterium]|nr:DedA family protein [Burkholderiales bacterium]
MIAAFIASYGYLAVFVGTLLEGETVLIAAGFAAHQGLLDWPLVVLVAAAGGTLGDQSAFLLGRWKGAVLLERFPGLARRIPRVHALLERFDAMFILAVRFLYGLRIAGPLIMGSSRVPVLRFAVFNTIGAAIWAVLVSGAGYVFGVAISSFIADLRRIEEAVFLSILALGIVFWLWRKCRA